MIRDALLPHWSSAMPSDELATLLAAWRGGRSCIDCRWWAEGEGDDARRIDAVNYCGAPGNRSPGGSFMVPADYTCRWFAAPPVEEAKP